MTRKFKVCLQQYVEEVASIEVEADSAEQARERALDIARHEQATFTWQAGDDATAFECYAVIDSSGQESWYR